MYVQMLYRCVAAMKDGDGPSVVDSALLKPSINILEDFESRLLGKDK